MFLFFRWHILIEISDKRVLVFILILWSFNSVLIKISSFRLIKFQLLFALFYWTRILFLLFLGTFHCGFKLLIKDIQVLDILRHFEPVERFSTLSFLIDLLSLAFCSIILCHGTNIIIPLLTRTNYGYHILLGALLLLKQIGRALDHIIKLVMDARIDVLISNIVFKTARIVAIHFLQLFNWHCLVLAQQVLVVDLLLLVI